MIYYFFSIEAETRSNRDYFKVRSTDSGARAQTGGNGIVQIRGLQTSAHGPNQGRSLPGFRSLTGTDHAHSFAYLPDCSGESSRGDRDCMICKAYVDFLASSQHWTVSEGFGTQQQLERPQGHGLHIVRLRPGEDVARCRSASLKCVGVDRLRSLGVFFFQLSQLISSTP